MAEMVATTAILIVPALCLVALLQHLLHPRALPRALVAQGMPSLLIWPISLLVALAEGTIASGIVYGLAEGSPGILRGLSAAGGLLMAGFTVYVSYQLKRKSVDNVPCGCSGIHTYLSGWVAIRAGILATVAAVAGVLAEHVKALDLTSIHFLIELAAGTTFATLLWLSPNALNQPMRLRLDDVEMIHERGGQRIYEL